MLLLNHDAYGKLGMVFLKQKRYFEALYCFHKAYCIAPNNIACRYNLANALSYSGNEDEAIESLKGIVADHPDATIAWKRLALLLLTRQRPEEAVDCLEKLHHLLPDDPEVLCTLGILYYRQSRLSEAIKCLKHVVQLNRQHINALETLGAALHETGDLQQAEECFQGVLQIAPHRISALNNLGTVYLSMGLLEHAAAVLGTALNHEPENSQVRFNRALVRLALGDLPKAWSDYEARFATQHPARLQHPEFPRWFGEPLTGRTLLVQTEQGFGDTFQFVRYLTVLRLWGGQIILECQDQSVRDGLGDIQGIELIVRGEPLPAIDYQIPLLSLPGLFQTTETTIPCPEGYLKAFEYKVAEWKQRLKLRTGFLHVGLVWSGTRYRLNADRSLHLLQLLPLLEMTGIQFYGLQLGDDRQQIRKLQAKLIDLGAQIESFADTAAILTHLDLLISVDTAVAHLAGALGQPVWILLKYAPDWRWLRERHDSPWYRSARLFRQPQPGDWHPVVLQVKRELQFFRDRQKK